MSDPIGTDAAAQPSEEQHMTDPTTPIVDDEGPVTAPEVVPGLAPHTAEPTAPDTPAALRPERRGPSVPTIVWGLLFGLVATVVVVGQTSQVDLNLEVSAPLALLVAGVVLVVWGIAGLGRSRHTP